MVWVRDRAIPTERPPHVGEVISNFLRIEGATWSAWRISTTIFSVFQTGAATFLSSSSSVVLTRLSRPRSRPTTIFSGSVRESNPGLRICSQELWPLDHRGGHKLKMRTESRDILNIFQQQIYLSCRSLYVLLLLFVLFLVFQSDFSVREDPRPFTLWWQWQFYWDWGPTVIRRKQQNMEQIHKSIQRERRGWTLCLQYASECSLTP
jgi:hypothetical protein